MLSHGSFVGQRVAVDDGRQRIERGPACRMRPLAVPDVAAELVGRVFDPTRFRGEPRHGTVAGGLVRDSAQWCEVGDDRSRRAMGSVHTPMLGGDRSRFPHRATGADLPSRHAALGHFFKGEQ